MTAFLAFRSFFTILAEFLVTTSPFVATYLENVVGIADIALWKCTTYSEHCTGFISPTWFNAGVAPWKCTTYCEASAGFISSRVLLLTWHRESEWHIGKLARALFSPHALRLMWHRERLQHIRKLTWLYFHTTYSKDCMTLVWIVAATSISVATTLSFSVTT